MLKHLFESLGAYAERVLAAGMPVVNASIPISGFVSGDIDLRQGQLCAIFVPTMNGATALLTVMGGFDTTSANFLRCVRENNPVTTAALGDLRWLTGTGSRMALWPSPYPTPPYVRLETDVAQTGARSFQILYKAR